MTYCIIIESRLSTQECPLDKGACYWQHRGTKACCYSEKEMTQEEFCALTGAELPNLSVDEFRELLQRSL
jgi:hypothetical protein